MAEELAGRRRARVWAAKLLGLFRQRRAEREFRAEMDEHLRLLAERFRARGMSEDEAWLAARRQFGNAELTRQRHREGGMVVWMANLGRDVRYAVRQLAANPAFTVVMVLTLGLSIGANSAIFSVIDSVLLKPLPYPDADRLMRLFLANTAYPQFPLNPWDFHDYRSRSQSFESLAAYTRADLQLSGAGEPVRLSGFRITAGYFHTLGLTPQMGREFDAQAEIAGNAQQVILSDGLWRRSFGADPHILGRKITLESQPYTVVAVMPAGTTHPGNGYRAVPYGTGVDAWVPFAFEGNPAQRGSHYLEGIGRLKPGVTAQQAQAEMNAIMAQLARDHGNDVGWDVHVLRLYEVLVGADKRMLQVLLGAVGMVLLIACANAANLQLARASARQRELAVRLALGASRARLIRQMLTESVLLSVAGGALGLALAVGGVKTLVSLLPAGFPRASEIHVNGPVFAFTLLISVLAGVLFGLAPAWHASRSDAGKGLHEGRRGSTGSGQQIRLRNALVISEVGLACALLIGGGLMLRSFLNQLRQNPGFERAHVLTASLSLPSSKYQKYPQKLSFYNELQASLGVMPGVQSAGIGSDLPWTGYDDNAGFNIEGKQAPPEEGFHGRYHMATPDYFRALGIPLLQGRPFRAGDVVDAPMVTIINHAMASRYWPGEDAVGKRITFEDKPKAADWITIVGVVGDVKDRPNSPGAAPAFWWSLQQSPFGSPDMALVVRSDADPQLLADAVRAQVRRLDPSLAVANIRLMDQIADAGVAAPRFIFLLVGLFAGLAMVLAAIGTYGVLAYSVSRRTPEFGLRMALGAQRGDVMRLVMGQAAVLVLAGAGLGIGLALLLGRVMKSLVYDVSPADPATFAAVTLMVVAVAAIACYLPARRATKADPMIALRSE
jgi:predicted permease